MKTKTITVAGGGRKAPEQVEVPDLPMNAICVCPTCGRLYATSTAKNRLYCSGIGTERHEGVRADWIEVCPVTELEEAKKRLCVCGHYDMPSSVGECRKCGRMHFEGADLRSALEGEVDHPQQQAETLREVLEGALDLIERLHGGDENLTSTDYFARRDFYRRVISQSPDQEGEQS